MLRATFLVTSFTLIALLSALPILADDAPNPNPTECATTTKAIEPMATEVAEPRKSEPIPAVPLDQVKPTFVLSGCVDGPWTETRTIANGCCSNNQKRTTFQSRQCCFANGKICTSWTSHSSSCGGSCPQ